MKPGRVESCLGTIVDGNVLDKDSTACDEYPFGTTEAGGATVLSLAMLDVLEERLARHAPDILAQLGDHGATPDELAEANARLGAHTLAGEAITWWTWRNPPLDSAVEIVPQVIFVPLKLAVNARDARLQMRYDAAAGAPPDAVLADPDIWWSPRWLPFLGPLQQHMICVDCDVPPGQPAPVRNIDWQTAGREGYDVPVAVSVGTLVEQWIRALESGAYVRADGTWQWSRRTTRSDSSSSSR